VCLIQWVSGVQALLAMSTSDRHLGSLGIPRIPWLEKLHLQTRSTKEYLFYDTSLNEKIENAFQALALDEVIQLPLCLYPDHIY